MGRLTVGAAGCWTWMGIRAGPADPPPAGTFCKM